MATGIYFTIYTKDIMTPMLLESWKEWGEGTGVEPAQEIIHDDINGFSAAEPSYSER